MDHGFPNENSLFLTGLEVVRGALRLQQLDECECELGNGHAGRLLVTVKRADLHLQPLRISPRECGSSRLGSPATVGLKMRSMDNNNCEIHAVFIRELRGSRN